MSAAEIFNLGITELNLGNPKKALSLFEKVLEIVPDHIGALVKKANIFGKFGKYPDAISIYDRVIKAEPQNALALINKGLALHYLARYGEAIACFDEVLKIKSDNTTALYNKASSLAKQGRTDESLDILGRAIRLDHSFKYKAKFDIDFEHIRTNSDFKKLTL